MTMRLAMIVGLAALLAGPAMAADEASIHEGQAVYDHWCAPCHAAGPGHPGTQALEVLYSGEKPAALTEREDLTPDVTTYFVRNGVSIMPFFRKTEISDAELAALAAYLAPERK